MNEEIPEEIREVIRTAVVSACAGRSSAEVERAIAYQEQSWLRQLNSPTPLNAGTFPDPRADERKWVCFSTALSEGWLMLYCDNTGAHGVVKDPTREEWGWSFDCPSNPKPWLDSSRVTVMKEGK